MIREHCLTRPERIVEKNKKGNIEVRNKSRRKLTKRIMKEEKNNE